jgi:hypothetical protein
MKSRENEKIWDLYLESPWRYQSSSSIDNFDNISAEYLNKNGSKVDTFENIDVYTLNQNPTFLVFVLNGEIVSVYRWENSVITGAIQTKFIWNHKNYKGIFRKIFAEYILPKFQEIQSDDMLTDRAFSFWEKMMVEYPKFNYYVIYKGEWIELKNPSEINKYKGDSTDDSTFFVSTQHS